jgi:hypothetical protein
MNMVFFCINEQIVREEIIFSLECNKIKKLTKIIKTSQSSSF